MSSQSDWTKLHSQSDMQGRAPACNKFTLSSKMCDIEILIAEGQNLNIFLNESHAVRLLVELLARVDLDDKDISFIIIVV